MTVSREELFLDIWSRLKKPFPMGSIEAKKGLEGAKYIPVQVYIHRLNEVAGIHYSWSINNTIVDNQNNVVVVTGTLSIVDAKRDGIGSAIMQRDTSGSVINLKDTIRSAASDALRNACDLYEMGWHDLAPFRDWGRNPGAGIKKSSHAGDSSSVSQGSGVSCVKCRKMLSDEDLAFLKMHRITVKFCRDDVPNHFLKNSR